MLFLSCLSLLADPDSWMLLQAFNLTWQLDAAVDV